MRRDEQEALIVDGIMEALDLVYADPSKGYEMEFETDMGVMKVFVVMEAEAPEGTVLQ